MRVCVALAFLALCRAVPIQQVVNNDDAVEAAEDRAWSGQVAGMPDVDDATAQEGDSGVVMARIRPDVADDDEDDAAIDALPSNIDNVELMQTELPAPGNGAPVLHGVGEAGMATKHKLGKTHADIPEHLNGETYARQPKAADALGDVDPTARYDMAAHPVALTPDPYALEPLPLEPDCDSPQSGEPDEQDVEVDMNKVHLTKLLREQSTASRKVPLDRGELRGGPDYLLARATPGDEDPLDVDQNRRKEILPPPESQSQLQVKGKKVKCSRNVNGHDVPNSLDQLDDDCGMPEPVIPCETAGNTTMCIRRIELQPQAVPEAELMPQPPPEKKFDVTLSVEFVDFGETRDVLVNDGNLSIAQVIEEAGSDWRVDAGQIQLVRNAGADFTVDSPISEVDDALQLIVYLRCTYREYQAALKMQIPSCPDLVVRNFMAQIEIPAFHETQLNKDYVKQVEVLSTDLVSKVIQGTKLDPDTLLRITYNGKDVTPDMSLEEIFFRNGSTFVLYPADPCPSHSPSPTPSATVAPSSSPIASPLPGAAGADVLGLGLHNKTKKRKLGGYDSYRHCKSSRNDKIQPPPPESVGFDPIQHDPRGLADPDAPDCDDDEMTPPEEEEDDETMTRTLSGGVIGESQPEEPVESDRVIVTVVYTSDIEPEIRIQVPVNIEVAKGIDLFDALRLASGRPHPYMEGSYNETYPVDHYTRLKPLGLKDGAVVVVRDLDKPLADDNLREFDVVTPTETFYDKNLDVMKNGENETIPIIPSPESPEDPYDPLTSSPAHPWGVGPGDVGNGNAYRTKKAIKAENKKKDAERKAKQEKPSKTKLRG